MKQEASGTEQTVGAAFDNPVRLAIAGDLSAAEDGDWFLRHLIAEVGKPPVWGFCAIVVLFSLILGPGLLLVTQRLGRRSLLVFLVPAISLLATAAIVVYNVVHEGFDTYVRVTSVTRYNHWTGDAFTWSRQTYFSGWPPREGLSVPGQALLRPVSEGVGRYGYYGNPRKGIDARVYLNDEGQVWKSWLKPRQQMQMLIVRPADDFRPPVDVRPTADGRVEVENLTDQALPMVAVRRDDLFFVHVDLQPHQTVAPPPLRGGEISEHVRQIASGWLPERPAELDEYGSLWSFGFGDRYLANAAGMPNDAIGKTLRTTLQSLHELQTGQYVVVVPTNPAIPIPLDNGEVTEQLHVVIGEGLW
ncbi:MAG: hypothetical protein D6753_08435 [Planctomycetota bacterium]|nr:MAG: hypothetical protein D6753_08435 [Planctomycetota bacterium]